MGDIWFPGLPPAYSSYAECLSLLTPFMPTHNDAVILAAIAGHESGYDYHVVNDTPATGDYSVGLFQINYYDGLMASRSARYGSPQMLAASGPNGQCQAAADLWHQAGGFSPWAADLINNVWQKYVGSGPIPQVPGVQGVTFNTAPLQQASAQVQAATVDMKASLKLLVDQQNALKRVAVGGWRPWA